MTALPVAIGAPVAAPVGNRADRAMTALVAIGAPVAAPVATEPTERIVR